MPGINRLLTEVWVPSTWGTCLRTPPSLMSAGLTPLPPCPVQNAPIRLSPAGPATSIQIDDAVKPPKAEPKRAPIGIRRGVLERVSHSFLPLLNIGLHGESLSPSTGYAGEAPTPRAADVAHMVANALIRTQSEAFPTTGPWAVDYLN